MSQHIFSTSIEGKPVTVLMGWDRPQQEFFLVVELDEPPAGGDSYLYSNMADPRARGRDLEYFKSKLDEFGIAVPRAMLQQVRLDHWDNVGNRNCIYAANGTFSDSNPPRPAMAVRLPQFGEVAKHYLNRQLELQVLSSENGFYIGTCDEDGPVSRESMEYFAGRDEAERALASGTWTQKMTV